MRSSKSEVDRCIGCSVVYTKPGAFWISEGARFGERLYLGIDYAMFAHRFPHTSLRSVHLALLTALAYTVLIGLLKWMALPLRADNSLTVGAEIWLHAGALVFSAVSVWLFARLLALTVSGARPYERLWYTGLFLSLSPIFIVTAIRGGMTAPAIACALAALLFGLRALERAGGHHALFAIGFSIAAWRLTPGLAWLLFPLLFAVFQRLYGRRRFGWLAVSFALLLAGMVVWWRSLPEQWTSWSVVHLFDAPPGPDEWAPNIVWLLYSIAHPGFGMLLPLLFLAAKRTELHHLERQVLFYGLILFLLFTGGLPRQEVGVLLPAYIIALLLFFPAWDRVLSYGFFILKKKYMYAILGLVFVVQLLANLWILFGLSN